MSWIGVDLDGTLAKHDFVWPEVGSPVTEMVERVRACLDAGMDMRIFTARAGTPEQIPIVEVWCMEHLGRALPVTDRKDYEMAEAWDDRAFHVLRDTGRFLVPPNGAS